MKNKNTIEIQKMGVVSWGYDAKIDGQTKLVSSILDIFPKRTVNGLVGRLVRVPTWDEIIDLNIDFNWTITINPELTGDSRHDSKLYNFEIVTQRMIDAFQTCPYVDHLVMVTELGKNHKPHAHALLHAANRHENTIKRHFNKIFRIRPGNNRCTVLKPRHDTVNQEPLINRWLGPSVHPDGPYLQKEPQNKISPILFLNKNYLKK